MKYIVILGDGMADWPVEKLNNKTPLEVANKPVIDNLCKNGTLGLVKTVADGIKPGSDVANLSVMGYDIKKYYTGRSPLEAASIGVSLKDDDITFRCNLVTLSDETDYCQKTMLDYSSGEITTDEARQIMETIAKELNTDCIKFYPGISYRHLMVWTGGSTNVKLTPPHDISDKKVTGHLPEGDGADIIADMMKKSEAILKNHPVNISRKERGLAPATSIWLWGEGKKATLDSFKEKFNKDAAVISAVDLIRGIGICADMQIIDVPGITGNIDTNFEGKAEAALNALLCGKDLVYVHMEAPDECGHHGEVENKVKAIEYIDNKVVKYIKEGLDKAGVDYKFLILPDHPTPLSIKTHSSDPVPFVIYDSTKQKNNPYTYTEANAKQTGLYIDPGHDLMPYFLKD